MMKIPKKAAKPLLEEISTCSLQFKSEIQIAIVQSVRSVSSNELRYKHVYLVNNESLSAKFSARKQKMSNKTEEFAFVRVESLERAREIAQSGVPVSSELSSDPPTALGNPAMGVYLSKFIDYSSREKLLAPNEECVMIMCKVLKGKWKTVVESDSLFDPTYDYDSHVSKSAGTSGGLVSSIQNYHSFYLANQIFVFEYNDEMETEKFPSNVLPFAVLNFVRDVPDFSSVSSAVSLSPLKSFSVTSRNPSLRPLKPLTIWSGPLQSASPAAAHASNQENNPVFEEDSVLVSFYSRVKPFTLTDKLSIVGWLDLSNLEHYFSESVFNSPPAVSGTSQVVQEAEVNTCVYYSYFQILSRQQLKEIEGNIDHVPSSSFTEFFKNPLHSTKAAVSKLADSVLYIFSSGTHAHRIGVTSDVYNPPVLHCIFVSSKPIYNTNCNWKMPKSVNSEYTANVGPTLKHVQLESRAFAMVEPTIEVQKVTNNLCSFGVAVNLAETSLVSTDNYYLCDVISNQFDLSYYSNDPVDIPVESTQYVERTLSKIAEMQSSQERHLENREKAAKQREMEEMRAKLASMEQEHRRNIEKEMASNNPAQTVINTFSLPKEGGLQRSFKKKNTDSSKSQVNKVRRPTNPPSHNNVAPRQSILSSRSSDKRSQDDEWKQRRAAQIKEINERRANQARVDQMIPLNVTSATEPELESISRGSSPSPPPIIPVSLSGFHRKGGGLLDMPMPPTHSRSAYVAPSRSHFIEPDLKGEADMEISNSPSSNGEPSSKYIKTSNGHFKTDQLERSQAKHYPPYLDDHDMDVSPEAPPIIIDDSPVKSSSEGLGVKKRPLKSESEDDHPTLDGSIAAAQQREAGRLSSHTHNSRSKDYVTQDVVEPPSQRRGVNIDLSGKHSDLPDAPYAKPDRPHFKVEDGRSDRRKAFYVDDPSIPKPSDFAVKTVGELTEYVHDKDDNSRIASRSISSSREASRHSNGNRSSTVLTNQLGQKIDIANVNNNEADNPYKPPPSWRPEDPAEMCKNLTVSFFKSKLSRISRPPRNLNKPRFKGYRFQRSYEPNDEAVRRLTRMIYDSEDRAVQRRREEAETRERLQREVGRFDGTSETTEVSTEQEMRLLQRRLGRELRNDAFDDVESRFLDDMLELNLGLVPGRSRSRGLHYEERSRDRSDSRGDRDLSRTRYDGYRR